MSRAVHPHTGNKTTFNIAGLTLCVRGCGIEPLPGVLTNFLSDSKEPIRNIQYLDAGLFFSQNHARGVNKEFNDRLLSHVYSQLLAMDRGLLLHATAVAKEGKAYIFFGSSGGGKSTVAALSRNYEVLADDVVAVRKIGGVFYAFSTPWRQSGFVKSDRRMKAKVAALFFLKKSKRIYFEPMSGEEALSRILMSQIHFFNHAEAPLVEEMFCTASELVKSSPAYEMEFKKDENFWGKFIYDKSLMNSRRLHES